MLSIVRPVDAKVARRRNLPDEQDQQVNPHSEVRQPAKSLQGSNLSNDHAGSHEDNETCDKANALFGDLRDRLAVGQNQDGNCEQKLDSLEKVDTVTGPAAVDAEEAVGVRLHGIFVGIHIHEYLPQLEA